jgi:TPP-dependent pyruvate/acetoin dehydrogenase alpha subunit
LKTEVEEEISAALRFAEESPYPQPEELYMDVIGD